MNTITEVTQEQFEELVKGTEITYLLETTSELYKKFLKEPKVKEYSVRLNSFGRTLESEINRLDNDGAKIATKYVEQVLGNHLFFVYAEAKIEVVEHDLKEEKRYNELIKGTEIAWHVDEVDTWFREFYNNEDDASVAEELISAIYGLEDEIAKLNKQDQEFVLEYAEKEIGEELDTLMCYSLAVIN